MKYTPITYLTDLPCMDFLAYKISTIVQDTSSHNGFPRTSQKINMDANFANLPGYKQTSIVAMQISTKWLPTSGLYQTMLVPEWAPYSCKIQSAQVLPIYLMELDSTWAPCLTPAQPIIMQCNPSPCAHFKPIWAPARCVYWDLGTATVFVYHRK